jgi:hypothetical protein
VYRFSAQAKHLLAESEYTSTGFKPLITPIEQPSAKMERFTTEPYLFYARYADCLEVPKHTPALPKKTTTACEQLTADYEHFRSKRKYFFSLVKQCFAK